MSELREAIRRKMVAAIADFEMLRDGDRVLAAVSGGKDSTIMMLLLEDVRRRSKVKFTVDALLLDQSQPGFNPTAYQTWFEEQGMPLTIIKRDTYGVVIDKIDEGKSFCSLCSRLRRGVLYRYAADNGYTKIALGHHREDLNETVLMSMFYSGQIRSMPPKLRSDDGRNTVIRPLCYVPEQKLIELQQELQFPIIPCNLCGSQENMRRKAMKELIAQLEVDHPGVSGNLLAAQGNVRISQLMDTELWDFSNL